MSPGLLRPNEYQRRDFEHQMLRDHAINCDRCFTKGIYNTLRANGPSGIEGAVMGAALEWNHTKKDHKYFEKMVGVRSARIAREMWSGEKAQQSEWELSTAHEKALFSNNPLIETQPKNKTNFDRHCCVHIQLPNTTLYFHFYPPYFIFDPPTLIKYVPKVWEQDTVAKVQTFLVTGAAKAISKSNGNDYFEVNWETFLRPAGRARSFIRYLDREKNSPEFSYLEISTREEDLPEIENWLLNFDDKQMSRTRQPRLKGL